MEKISYEHRVYESVDEESLSYYIYLRIRWEKLPGSNGLRHA